MVMVMVTIMTMMMMVIIIIIFSLKAIRPAVLLAACLIVLNSEIRRYIPDIASVCTYSYRSLCIHNDCISINLSISSLCVS